ncbi:MAG: bifunctional alpha,alpha-trehalose-phosphate synthase (UDP-forming)/trehalose-phosphatase [Promethearchaeota archaeon]
MSQYKRLIIISNRLPVTISRVDGKLEYNRSLGGLATGLASFHKQHNSLWVGWPGINLESIEDVKDEVEQRLISEFNCYPIFLTQEEIEKHYLGFCNVTLWPLFHLFIQYTSFDDQLWQAYEQVNKKFHKTILQIYGPNDIIWIQDYHLLLLPKLIRDSIADSTIAFFLHIPFPSYEVFRILPWREEVLEGLLGSDLIGFHTYDYERHFLSSVHRILGLELNMNKINFQGRNVKVDCFPMGIDYDRYSKQAERPETKLEIQKIRKEIGDRKIIFSIDRMDYTKGILQRLEAYECFLETYPEYREMVTLIFVTAPSRSRVEEYQMLKSDIDELVGKINGRFSTIGWNPILYIHRPLPLDELVSLYAVSNVALITPIRDGMNLIVKEYITSKIDGKGVLILSETAGAAKELSEALIVNTNNKMQIVNSIKQALEMPEELQIRRMRKMQNRIKNYTVSIWADDIIYNLIEQKNQPQDKTLRILTTYAREILFNNYKTSEKRLIILDYDGTLVPFFEVPEGAIPDDEIIFLIKKMTLDPKNTLILISGRDKDTLNEWFGELNIHLIAEHGLWEKKRNDKWKIIELLKNDWKEEIHSILERYVRRTPGSFIEEKDYSLAWHYRNVEYDLGAIRSKELLNILENHCYNTDLSVLDGNKVIEVKNSSINKGRAISKHLTHEKWDFIMILGDDMTDEDMFEIAPDSAYTIKVGLKRSKARYNIISYKDSRSILKTMNELNKI